MLIKPPDDKSKRLALLQDLQQSALLDHRQREWVRDELYRTKRGLAGERDAAHFLDNYLKDDPDRMLLHDLRFVVDGEVAQIDHMVITRSLFVYLLETKNFNGNLHINERGEFSVAYAGDRILGIPSPLEQSRRHEGPVRKLFERLDIRGRNGGAPRFEHCVLVSPTSVIHRPPADAFDSTHVIKADQFRAWHERFQDKATDAFVVVSSLFNIRSAATIEAFARKLARQHQPADPLALPDFLHPCARPGTTRPDPHSSVPRDSELAPAPSPPAPIEPDVRPDRRRLQCATCGARISFPEGRFCWNNERRFGGLQYCRAHQAAFP